MAKLRRAEERLDSVVEELKGDSSPPAPRRLEGRTNLVFNQLETFRTQLENVIGHRLTEAQVATLRSNASGVIDTLDTAMKAER